MDRGTDDQENWWGTQPCRRCNPQAVVLRPLNHAPRCPDCDGSGWTEWAALATEPWTEIVPGLFVGGHDFTVWDGATYVVTSIAPKREFDTVVSMYHRDGFAPSEGVEHHEVIFPDAPLEDEVQRQAVSAGHLVAQRVSEGKSVLVRCRAGLNRSSLVASLALLELGFSGTDAVQLIRARRSPWALCNEHYVAFITEMSAALVTVSGEPREERGTK